MVVLAQETVSLLLLLPRLRHHSSHLLLTPSLHPLSLVGPRQGPLLVTLVMPLPLPLPRPRAKPLQPAMATPSPLAPLLHLQALGVQLLVPQALALSLLLPRLRHHSAHLLVTPSLHSLSLVRLRQAPLLVAPRLPFPLPSQMAKLLLPATATPSLLAPIPLLHPQALAVQVLAHQAIALTLLLPPQVLEVQAFGASGFGASTFGDLAFASSSASGSKNGKPAGSSKKGMAHRTRTPAPASDPTPVPNPTPTFNPITSSAYNLTTMFGGAAPSLAPFTWGAPQGASSSAVSHAGKDSCALCFFLHASFFYLHLCLVNGAMNNS